MSTVMTTMETVVPKPAGDATYIWVATEMGKRITSQDAADDGETGVFSSPQEARLNVTAWVHVRKHWGLSVPEEIMILRAQYETFARVYAE